MSNKLQHTNFFIDWWNIECLKQNFWKFSVIHTFQMTLET